MAEKFLSILFSYLLKAKKANSKYSMVIREYERLFYFQSKMMENEKFIYIAYQNGDKEQTLNQFKNDCEDQVMGLNNDCWIRSIRKGKMSLSKTSSKSIRL